MKNDLIISLLLLSLGVAQNNDNYSVMHPGDKYAAEIIEGKKDGQGTVTFSNGDTYIGEFKNGSFHGQGTLHVAGGEKYEGGWKAGKKEGKGDRKSVV